MRPFLIALAACSLVFAGCTGNATAGADVPDETFNDLDLKATETTGVIRGVAYDAAIVPLAGVVVRVTSQASDALEMTTTETGAFGFSALEPGTYFIVAEKPGYLRTQQSTDVVAGVKEPTVVKLLLEADPVNTPFAQGYVFDGFIECSVSIIAVGFAACSSVSALNDRFIQNYDLPRIPHWAQAEMHWESTQTVNGDLTLLFSAPGEGALLDNYGEAAGESPLLVLANQTTLEFYNVGAGYPLQIRVFNHPIEGTDIGDPVNGDDCLDRPVLGGCATGLGFTIEQEFAVYTHVFYGFVPDSGWLFSVDGEPQP